MREFIPQIAASLREDETWHVGPHWAANDKLGIKVWVANGYWFVYLEWATERGTYGRWSNEVRIDLSLPEKFVIWRACKKLRKLSRKRKDAALLENIIQRRLQGETK